MLAIIHFEHGEFSSDHDTGLSKKLSLSGGSVVEGAGVVVTGPQTASFLKVQNFLNIQELNAQSIVYAQAVINPFRDINC